MTFNRKEFGSRCNSASGFTRDNCILQHSIDGAVYDEIESETLSKEYLERVNLSLKEFNAMPFKHEK